MFSCFCCTSIWCTCWIWLSFFQDISHSGYRRRSFTYSNSSTVFQQIPNQSKKKIIISADSHPIDFANEYYMIDSTEVLLFFLNVMLIYYGSLFFCSVLMQGWSQRSSSSTASLTQEKIYVHTYLQVHCTAKRWQSRHCTQKMCVKFYVRTT